MEIEFFGANAVRITVKKASFIFDDNLKSLGGKNITKADDISLQTDMAIPLDVRGRLTLDAPGEYEVSDVSINAVALRGHRDEDKQRTCTAFKLHAADARVIVLGHAHPDITDQQVEALGEVDILVLPVGGNGFTLDPVGALKVIKKLQPTVVIPTGYAVAGITSEVPQISLEDAINQLALPQKETVSSYKVKNVDFDTEQASVLVVESYKK